MMYKCIVSFVIVSFCISIFMENGIKKGLMKRNGIICMAALLAALFVWKLCGRHWTIYEFVLAGSQISIAAVSGMILFKKKESIMMTVLKAFCSSAFITAVYSILTCGRTRICSDTATASILADSQVKHQCLFPETWNYANGDIWVLKQNIPVLFIRNFIEDQSLVRTLASVIIVCVTVAGIIYHSKTIFKDQSYLLSVPLFLVFLYGSEAMILYQAMYTDQMLWIAFGCSLLYIIYKKYEAGKWNRFVFLYGMLLILLLTGGIRMMAEQTVPAAMTCLFMMYDEIRTRGGGGKKKRENKKMPVYVRCYSDSVRYRVWDI